MRGALDGVPVLTLAGKRHASSVGVSLLSQVGLGEMIASSETEYVEKAQRLAGDPDGLAELRGTLRDRMESSSLRDAQGFANRIETAYRDMWRHWCAAGPGA